jgi:hypothetical protein
MNYLLLQETLSGSFWFLTSLQIQDRRLRNYKKARRRREKKKRKKKKEDKKISIAKALRSVGSFAPLRRRCAATKLTFPFR